MKKIMIKKLKTLIRKSPSLFFLANKILSFYYEFGSNRKWRNLLKNKTIKLELGSGPKKGINGWTTIDQGGIADISWDLRRGIPLPDNSVDNIYSSHLLEHIPFKQLIPFLHECRRIMKSDAEFSVCVPNFCIFIDSYKERKLFTERDTWWKPGLIDTGSAMDQLNYMAYMGDEHKYLFDKENLINTLTKAGFSNVKLRNFDEELDMLDRDNESIYAIANK